MNAALLPRLVLAGLALTIGTAIAADPSPEGTPGQSPPGAAAPEGTTGAASPPPAEPSPGQAAQQPAPQESPPAAPAAQTAQTVLPLQPGEAVGVLGKKVQGPNGENMGMIVDVIVDHGGAPTAAVIDFGGFLGVGTRKIAINWPLLHDWNGDQSMPVHLSLNRAEVQAAPEYKGPGQKAEIVGPPAAAPAPSPAPPPAATPPASPPSGTPDAGK